MTNNCQSTGGIIVCPPVRNRYFYGKMLDVCHFEMEQRYMNEKRWLLNRLVAGYGVVCGLGVQLGSDQKSVVVSPGVAIDKCGREIIVCQQSDPIPLPPPQPQPQPPANVAGGGDQGGGAAPANPAPGAAPALPPGSKAASTCADDAGSTYCYLSICYHECQTDPSPAFGGDCDTQSMCSPGAIRERYCLKLTNGRLCPASTTSPLQAVISNGGGINYGLLASYVSKAPCLGAIQDCCIPLANIQIPTLPATTYMIDGTICPIVFTNDLLYQLIVAISQGSSNLQGGK
jgi:hypothetical protein